MAIQVKPNPLRGKVHPLSLAKDLINWRPNSYVRATSNFVGSAIRGAILLRRAKGMVKQATQYSPEMLEYRLQGMASNAGDEGARKFR